MDYKLKQTASGYDCFDPRLSFYILLREGDPEGKKRGKPVTEISECFDITIIERYKKTP